MNASVSFFLWLMRWGTCCVLVSDSLMVGFGVSLLQKDSPDELEPQYDEFGFRIDSEGGRRTAHFALTAV